MLISNKAKNSRKAHKAHKDHIVWVMWMIPKYTIMITKKMNLSDPGLVIQRHEIMDVKVKITTMGSRIRVTTHMVTGQII